MSVFLLSGYRGTGKDSLYTAASEGRLQWRILESLRGDELWHVYCNDGADPEATLDDMLYGSPVRQAFADALKADVHQRLGLVEHIDTIIGKDDPITEDGKTLRDFYIERAAEVRSTDPSYYAQRVRRRINPLATTVITDFRYREELEEFPFATTVRLYRSAVPVPPVNVPSEHQLDGIMHDILLVAAGDTPPALYASYVLHGGLVSL